MHQESLTSNLTFAASTKFSIKSSVMEKECSLLPRPIIHTVHRKRSRERLVYCQLSFDAAFIVLRQSSRVSASHFSIDKGRRYPPCSTDQTGAKYDNGTSRTLGALVDRRCNREEGQALGTRTLGDSTGSMGLITPFLEAVNPCVPHIVMQPPRTSEARVPCAGTHVVGCPVLHTSGVLLASGHYIDLQFLVIYMIFACALS